MIRWWRKEIKSEEMWRLKKERNKLSKETTALSNLQANITQRKGGGKIQNNFDMLV